MNMPPLRLVSSLTLSAAVLAGCVSSPPVHYYTLQGPARAATAPPSAPAAFMLEVQDVSVISQADQPQLMVRTGDGSVAALYSERWTSSLGDEIRSALSDALQRELGVPDVLVVKPGPKAPVWRVQMDVQRFELVSGRMAQLDATWRVRPINLAGTDTGWLCRSIATEQVTEAGVPALVAGQQRAVTALASAMAAAIRGEPPTQTNSTSLQTLGCSPLKD